MIKINSISKSYFKNGKEFIALDNVCLEITKSCIVGLLGPNGAGKTTLIKMICNLVTPTTGTIEIQNENIYKKPNIIHDKVGVLLEGARNLYNFLTVEENLNYFSFLNEMDKEKFEEQKDYLLKLFDLENKRKETVNNLSRGMQQKVAILIAILKNPNIIILDEPTLGLDIVAQIRMKELLRRLAREFNKTLIISSHDISLIKDICDKVIIINKGKLVLYDDLHSLMFSKPINKYKVIANYSSKVKNYVNSQNEVSDIEIMNENLIKFSLENINSFINMVDGSDIYKIEKYSNDIEEILKGLGDKYENNRVN